MSYPDNLNTFKEKVAALQSAANQLPAGQNPPNSDSIKQALDAVNTAFSNIRS